MQKISVVNNEELLEFVEYAAAPKALLFEFDDGTSNYIDIHFFSNFQVKRIIAHIEEIKKSYDNQDPN